MSNRIEILMNRLVDLLIDDTEEIDELFLHVNYDYCDGILKARQTQFRLHEICDNLVEIESRGLIVSYPIKSIQSHSNIAFKRYEITARGREYWEHDIKNLQDLYS